MFLASGAAGTFEAAMEATGLTGRTNFVSALRLALEDPRAMPGISLSILQPLSPDIAALVVAAAAFEILGAYGVGGGALLLGILVVRLVFLSVVMTFFTAR